MVIAVICLLIHPHVIACFFSLAHCLINVAADENSVHKLCRISATVVCLFVCLCANMEAVSLASRI